MSERRSAVVLLGLVVVSMVGLYVAEMGDRADAERKRAEMMRDIAAACRCQVEP